jgi:hypothetical protein
MNLNSMNKELYCLYLGYDLNCFYFKVMVTSIIFNNYIENMRRFSNMKNLADSQWKTCFGLINIYKKYIYSTKGTKVQDCTITCTIGCTITFYHWKVVRDKNISIDNVLNTMSIYSAFPRIRVPLTNYINGRLTLMRRKFIKEMFGKNFRAMFKCGCLYVCCL